MTEKRRPFREIRVHAGRVSNLDFEKTMNFAKRQIDSGFICRYNEIATPGEITLVT
jgi:hypothetical protein